MYSLAGFGQMIDDRVRLQAYTEALRRAITPNSVVLDIGAGTGILSLLACHFGARHVYAIEPSSLGGIIGEAARDNGFSTRITVIPRKSSDVTLPERADVIVSDLHGVLPVFHTALADLADARTRLLAPAGRLIPAVETLFVAVVSAGQVFEARRRPWQSRPHGLALESALPYLSNQWIKHRAEPDDLLSAPQRFAVLDYHTLTNPRVQGSGRLAIRKQGIAHGLLVWFESTLCPEVGFSNAPGVEQAIYGQAFFPWPEAVPLREGDEIHFELRADPIGEHYQWTWTTEVRGKGAPASFAQRFRQSEFLSTPLTAETLRKRASDFTPTVSRVGELTLLALQRMRAGTSLEALAAELHATAPERFRTGADALDFVADISERYSG